MSNDFSYNTKEFNFDTFDMTSQENSSQELTPKSIAVSKHSNYFGENDDAYEKSKNNVVKTILPKVAPSDSNGILNDEDLNEIFSEDAAFIPESMQEEPLKLKRDLDEDLDEIKDAFRGNESSFAAAKARLMPGEKEYERIFIQYWDEDDVDKYQIAARRIQGKISSKNPLVGVVINSTAVKNPRTDKKNIKMQILLNDEKMQCIPAWISADEMSSSYEELDGKESDEKIFQLKQNFGRRIIGTKISFMPLKLIASNPDGKTPEDKQYNLIGSRVAFLSEVKKRNFDDPNNPKQIREGCLVEGVVVAVYGNRILFNVAGIDIPLRTTIPYLTGVSRLADDDIFGGRRLFHKNEKKQCVIDRITRDKEGKVRSIHCNFRLPLEKKIHEIVSVLNPGSYLQGTVLRFARGRTINGVEGNEYMIIKCAIGIEAACTLPGWSIYPEVGTNVTFRVAGINKYDQVFGFAKGY